VYPRNIFEAHQTPFTIDCKYFRIETVAYQQFITKQKPSGFLKQNIADKFNNRHQQQAHNDKNNYIKSKAV